MPGSVPAAPGMYKPEHVAAWKRIVDFVHGGSQARIGLQLGARRPQGSTRRLWEGIDEPLEDRQLAARLGLRGPVPPAQPGAARDGPAATWIACATTSSAPRGWRCRRTSISSELHVAHGYLLASLHLAADQPPDRWLWRLAGAAAAIPARGLRGGAGGAGRRREPISVRISATDWMDGGLEPAEAVEVARALTRSRVRRDRRLGRPDGARSAAGVRPALPDTVQRSDPPRGGHSHDDGRRHRLLR